MFSPQKLWALTPRSERGQKNGSISGSGLNPNPRSPLNGDTFSTGKALALMESDGPMDQDPLAERVSKLENELFEYQYNMGLLLIEKKEWTSKYEKLSRALEDTNDTLRREEALHINVISELEKREENLKKALGVERQCVLDLEKALRNMRSEHAEIKFNADSKLAEANVLVTSVEEKSLEVEARFHAADAKLAEVSRKSSEVERRLREVEAQENVLQRERLFFSTERKTQDTAISEQKEYMRELEQKLREAEQRLADSRRLMNQREERANDTDKMLKEKQNDLDKLRKEIEMANLTLRTKEEDISCRLANISLKEKEADDIRKSLEAKKGQLQEWEDKLGTRERSEVQKLLEEHEKMLAEKKREFELEMEQKRKLHDKQLKDSVVEVEKRETEVAHREEKVKKQEEATEKKLEKVKAEKMDLDTKSKALKEREKSLKIEEKNLETVRKQVLAEKEELLGLKAEFENIRADTENQLVRLDEEREQLKLTEEERLELEHLQSELKKEIDNYKSQSEQLMKEMDDLKQEREKFEKEWGILDDERALINKDQAEISKQKKYVEELTEREKERLHNVKVETQEYVQRELEALKLAKESFAASMEHEKSMLTEKYQTEARQLLHDFELRKEQLEVEVRKRQDEMENCLLEKEKSFEEEKEKDLSNIHYLREVARREMEEMQAERRGIEKEKLEILENKKHVETQQFEMKRDIEELVGLSQKLKDQREQFIKERDRFIAFAENQKGCNTCGEKIREFMLSDLHPLTEMNNLEAPPLPRAAEDYIKQAVKGTSEEFSDELSPVFNSGSSAGGTISWLRKCTSKIFKISPGKKLELDSAMEQTETSAPYGKQVDADSPEALPSGENDLETSLQVATDSFDAQIIKFNSGIREVEADITENSQNAKRIHQDGPQTEVRTRTMKGVVHDAKTILGQSPEDYEKQYVNGNADNSVHTNDETLGTRKNRRKRNINASQATVSENQSEGRSDSVKESDRPKRQRRVTTADQNFGQKRYNLRKPKTSIARVADGSLPQGRKGKGKEIDQQPSLEAANPTQNVEGGEASREEIQGPGEQATLAKGFGGEGGDGDEPVRSTGVASAFSADSSPDSFKYAGETQSEQAYTENVSVDNMAVSEEVIGTDVDSEGYKTQSRDEDDDNDDGDGDGVDHPGQASIGKKLWTFLVS